ncbi:17805_t:CDS:2 [Dentiscutata erythropus]|uniref:17805_t:CDS:1 n=1 Tax=Dentiscutata erythropus TaxID=1348616 RepID=A0A9N8ZG62_9GLOM|nr:17805_t:CDS:2 [Dentiscutata erythropus]
MYFPPHIDDLLEVFGQAVWFTSLDLLSGMYEFVVIPFVLCNAPATFQYMMNYVLANFIKQFIIVYLDDIVIYFASFNEHLYHIAAVFEILKAVGLKLNFNKCVFFRSHLQFLDHVVGQEGVCPDNNKVEKVQNFLTPVNLKQLYGFVGLALYYREFISNFASIACPLHHLLKKDYLTDVLVLRYPNFNKTFIAHADTSGTRLGAMLAQKDNLGKEYVVAYASQALTKPETNYSTTKLECLVVL